MSVVGCDDSRLARLAHIDLTTAGQDVPRLAELPVGRAIARMEAEAAPGPETVIAPRLVVRATTAAPRRALSSLPSPPRGTGRASPGRREADNRAPGLRAEGPRLRGSLERRRPDCAGRRRAAGRGRSYAGGSGPCGPCPMALP